MMDSSSNSAPLDEGEVALVAVVVNRKMPGGRQVSNNQSSMQQGRMGASQPTQLERIHGSAMGPAPTHMFANTAPPYNAHLQQQQHRPASGLLPSPQASASCYPTMPYQQQHGQFYANIAPPEAFHGQPGGYPAAAAAAAGGQFGQQQSSSGSYPYQTMRVANGFNGQAAPSMHPLQQQQQQQPVQLQRMSPLSTAVPLVHSRTPSTGNTPSPGPAAADSNALKQVYICCYCAQSGSPYRYEDTEHGGPPTLTECRSEHLMDAENCKQTFLQVFAADYKKATGNQCLEKEIIEEAHLCLLCQVVVLNKEFKRQLHLNSLEHKARKGAASAPAMVYHHQANEQVPPPPQQQQQHNLALQQRMVYQQPMQQEVYQYQGSPQPATNVAYHPPPTPYYPPGMGQVVQQQGGQQTGRHRRVSIPLNQSPANASPTTNEDAARKHNIRMVLQQQQEKLVEAAQAQALTVQAGVAGDMSPLGVEVEGRPSTASSISLDTPRDRLAYDDISPQGSPMAAQPSMALPLAPGPDKPMVYQSPMEMAEEVMKDGAGFPPDLDLAPLPAQVSLAQASPATVNQTVDVPPSVAPIPPNAPALVGTPRVAEVSAEIVATVNTSPATPPPEVDAKPAKALIAPPPVKEDGGSQSILELGGSDGEGEGKGAATATVPIKVEPKEEVADLRHAAANDIDADFFKHSKRPLSPTNHLPPIPPAKKPKVTLKKEGSVACDPGIHKKKKLRPQNVALAQREPHKLYICKCGELCQRKRDYFNHWERHTFPFADLSLAQRQLYCVRALCGYLATNDLDYTRHAARHVMLQVSYRKHHH